MSHHTLYGVKPLLLYVATFKFTRDDLSESALRRNIGDKGNVGSQRNMMNDVDIENLTSEQCLMLTQESQTQGMSRTKFDRMVIKDIKDMTIAEYMECGAEIKRNPWGYAKLYTRKSGSTNLGESKILENKHQPDKLKTIDYFPSIPPCFKPARPITNDIHEPLEKDLNDCQLSTPNSHHETEEVSSDEDVDEWLNAEMGKRMIGQDKDEEEDALIDILKTVVEECKGAGINMMPKSLFEHLKLTNLKKTSMVVEMADITKKPLGIMENILVKIDTLEGPNKTILLGRPFFAMIHAPVDVFRGEILLGIVNEKVKFDTNGEICHSRVPHEKIYMASSIQKGKYFNPHEVKNDDSHALEQRTLHYSKESIDIVDSSDDSQEDEVGSHLSKDVVSRWHVCKPVHVTFKVCEEDCRIWPTCNPDLSFCSGYDAIYEKEKMGCSRNGYVFKIMRDRVSEEMG
ncbi:hypothetical protein Tco_0452035 [Tanacetum coccineum]